MTTTTPAALLAEIPISLLRRSSPDYTRRAQDLERWCLARGFRPSLLDLERERRRRGIK